MEPVVFNPFEDGFHANPYGQYAQLRKHRPVGDGPLGTVLVFRYNDVRRVLEDKTLSSRDELATNTPAVTMRMAMFDGWMQRGVPSMMNTDPPEQTRLRKLVARAFTPAAVSGLRGDLEALTATYLDQLRDKQRDTGSVDIMADLAYPLPCEIISSLLGVPGSDRSSLQRWSLSLTKAFEALLDPRDVPEITEAGDRLSEYVSALAEDRRAHPGDDLISAMAAADGDDRLTDEELVDQVMLIYVAGHTTVSNFIGTSIFHLLDARARYEWLRTTPDVPQVVDELLRFEPPTQFIRRITRDEYRIGEVDIEPGRLVLACIGSANHDEDVYGPTADALDFRRVPPARLLSFGSGLHFCLGAALARLEGEIVLSSLARAFPDAALVTGPKWNQRITFRGVTELEVSLAG